MPALALRFALAVFWVTLAVVTHLPSVSIPTDFTYRDKIVHFCAFGTLAWLYARWRFDWTAPVVLLGYAAIDEYTQQFFGRNTDIFDYCANAAGILTMLGALALLRRRKAEVDGPRHRGE